MKQREFAVIMMGCLVGSYGFAHSVHCPPGEVLKNVLLDTLTDPSYKHHLTGRSAPLILKFNYHHHHWQLRMPFSSGAHTAQQQASGLRNTVVGARQTIAKKIDKHYYCHYPALSRGIGLVLSTTFAHAVVGRA